MDAPPQSITTPSAPQDLFCPDCGYDLHGITSDRCPECGLPIDRATAAESGIPWTHRRRIGRIRAYWRTVRLAVFHPRKLAAEVARPVSYFDAQFFRWVTILIVYLPNLATGIVAMCGTDTAQLGTNLGAPPAIAPWAVPLMLLGLLAGLILVTGVPSYFFHPRSIPVVRQNRAVALSYYACAALAPAAMLFYLSVALMLGMGAIGEPATRAVETPVLIFVLGLEITTGLFVVGFLWNTAILLRHTTGCGYGRRLVAAIAHTISVVLVTPLLVIGLPGVIGFILLLWLG